MKEKVKNNRLPFGLCIGNGIEIQDGWTTGDAWKALEKKTGKSMFQFFLELSKDELEDYAKTEIYDKNDEHPKEITSAVHNKISMVKGELVKRSVVVVEVYTLSEILTVKIYGPSKDYDYKILGRRKIK